MLYVVTGGSGSGKSAYAELQITSFQGADRYYIATMENRDEESKRRVARHRRMREGKGFVTLECPRNLESLELPAGCDALLECMSNLAANELFAGGKLAPADEVVSKILRGVDRLCSRCRNLVIVTNEVFSDGADYDPWTMEYLRCLGQINQEIAARADEVTEVVYTIPVSQKRGSCPDWRTPKASLVERVRQK